MTKWIFWLSLLSFVLHGGVYVYDHTTTSPDALIYNEQLYLFVATVMSGLVFLFTALSRIQEYIEYHFSKNY